MQNKKKVFKVIIIVLVLGFAAWAIIPIFTDTKVDEAAPENAKTVTTTETDGNINPSSDNYQTIDTSERVGTFSGKNSYDGSGTVRLIEDENGSKYVRFEENFSASNGPDLLVYIGTSDDRGVELGALKGNIGAQNYKIPDDVDLSSLDTVRIWCRSFNVDFAAATL